MQTRIALLALLSAMAAPAVSQVPTSAAVMRVDPATQRQRDHSRVVILQDELAAEALALSDSQKQARSDAVRADARAVQEALQRIARHRQNISALARELAAVERQAPGPAAAKAQATPPISSPRRIAEEWLLGGGVDSGNVQPATPRVAPDQRRGFQGTPEWFIPAAPAGNGR